MEQRPNDHLRSRRYTSSSHARSDNVCHPSITVRDVSLRSKIHPIPTARLPIHSVISRSIRGGSSRKRKKISHDMRVSSILSVKMALFLRLGDRVMTRSSSSSIRSITNTQKRSKGHHRPKGRIHTRRFFIRSKKKGVIRYMTRVDSSRPVSPKITRRSSRKMTSGNDTSRGRVSKISGRHLNTEAISSNGRSNTTLAKMPRNSSTRSVRISHGYRSSEVRRVSRISRR